jgi:hypothetical protein
MQEILGPDLFKVAVSKSVQTIELQLRVESANESAVPEFLGGNSLEYVVRDYLASAYGAFGHTIDPNSLTAIDLHAALASPRSPFTFEVLEGAVFVETYDPQIPANAIT